MCSSIRNSREPRATRADDAVTARERLAPVIDELPAGPLRAEALLWSGTFWSEDDTDLALTQLRRALADNADGGGPDEVSAAAHRQLAVVEVHSGDTFPADTHACHALTAATTSGDPASIAESRTTLAWTQFFDGHGLRPELLRLDPAPWSRFTPNNRTPGLIRGMLLGLTDDLDAARETLLAEYRDVRDRGIDRAVCIALATLVELERRAGNWEQAGEYAAEGHRVADVSGDGLGRHMLLQARGHLRARMGMLDAARADADDAVALGEAIASLRAVRFSRALLGFIELSEGNHEAVDGHLAPLTARVLRSRGFEPALARFVPDHVEALVALGELDRAEELLARFARQAVTVDRASAIADSARCRALLLAARGDADGAAASVADAVAAHDRLATPFERAHTLLVAGSIHRRGRRRRAARDALQEALATFAQLGSPHWADRARRELARIGGRAGSATALTGAEERIAALVAVGRSNREVAAELFITVSTVEAALWRIYRKLGIRSRTELAATRRAR